VNERRGNSVRISAAVLTPWLVRWLVLQDGHHSFHAPGEDLRNLVHVVCPEPECSNEDWVTRYEPKIVNRCGRHPGPRRPMVRCRACVERPGLHPKPVHR